MNCPQCGAAIEAGQTHCACGQYLSRARPDLDMPSEFYTRLENQVEKSGKENFRRGLLIGLGFLALFLLLETIMDAVFLSRQIFLGGILLAAAALIAFNLWLLVRKYLM